MKKLLTIFLFSFLLNGCVINTNNLHDARCAAVNFLHGNNISFNNAYVVTEDKKVTIVFSQDQKNKEGKEFEDKIKKLNLHSMFNIVYWDFAPMVGSPDCRIPNIRLQDI